MAYRPLSAFSKDSSQAIYLYTTPLRGDFVNGSRKKPIDIFAHWAVCIQGICYELRGGDKKKGEPKFLYKSISEQEWRETRQYKDREEPKHVGYMIRPYTPEVIDILASHVWKKTLKEKYVYDENNCQAFVRLLVELIGDPDAKAKLPHFFDKWVKNAGITRDISILGIATGATLIGVGLVTAPVDFGSTAAAGFGLAGSMVFSSSAALFNIRDGKAKHIQKAQKEIREELRLKHGIQLA
ncbi:uncharacterized protein BDR25DRAFT_304344 [Lindgomyces ingoldianus]|uniref:Uncharacterized protein n=1 Tax=Lindgomyces ingoldianus TaxID=673940 RepID=A0ACB6QU50_9PLEO|nr:uncharacterized protein BDR25DRAFT_304344 [Lindgomyces ingoldianus]KAF2469612.1 hypothetical protein BDR25DRAFT_304344 [Lindgomyces ingoldianus]